MALSATGHPDAIALGRSNLLLVWLSLAGVGAVVLMLAYLPWQLAAVLGTLVAWRAGVNARRHALRSGSDAIMALRLTETGIECQTHAGAWCAGDLVAGGFVSPMLTVFRWRQHESRGRPLTIVVLPDALEGDAFRRLRLYLLWKRV